METLIKAPPITVGQFLNFKAPRLVVIHEAAARCEVSDEESISLPHPFPALQLSAGEFFILQ